MESEQHLENLPALGTQGLTAGKIILQMWSQKPGAKAPAALGKGGARDRQVRGDTGTAGKPRLGVR